jgi:hypothetical protein
MATPIDQWLAAAVADAERRGLHDLRPLLEAMARSTAALRAADAALDARERQDIEATAHIDHSPSGPSSS